MSPFVCLSLDLSPSFPTRPAAFPFLPCFVFLLSTSRPPSFTRSFYCPAQGRTAFHSNYFAVPSPRSLFLVIAAKLLFLLHGPCSERSKAEPLRASPPMCRPFFPLSMHQTPSLAPKISFESSHHLFFTRHPPCFTPSLGFARR